MLESDTVINGTVELDNDTVNKECILKRIVTWLDQTDTKCDARLWFPIKMYEIRGSWKKFEKQQVFELIKRLAHTASKITCLSEIVHNGHHPVPLVSGLSTDAQEQGCSWVDNGGL